MYSYILHYILLGVLTRTTCAERIHISPELINLIKLIANFNKYTTVRPEAEDMFVDLTRTDGQEDDALEPRSEIYNKHKNKFLVKKIIAHKIDSLPDRSEGNSPIYRPLLKIHDVQFLNDISNMDRHKHSQIKKYSESEDRHSSEEYNKADTIQIFEIVKKVKDGAALQPRGRAQNESQQHGIPYYPPWNYWNYYKSLHQDVCPDQQVKLGKVCVWTPPH